MECSDVGKRRGPGWNLVDANHHEIVAALRGVGCSVMDLSPLGHGVPDLLVWNGRELRLLEVKNPKSTYGRNGLNKNQAKFASDWPVDVVYSVDEAIEMVRLAPRER
jgi:hypothetical protein